MKNVIACYTENSIDFLFCVDEHNKFICLVLNQEEEGYPIAEYSRNLIFTSEKNAEYLERILTGFFFFNFEDFMRIYEVMKENDDTIFSYILKILLKIQSNCEKLKEI